MEGQSWHDGRKRGEDSDAGDTGWAVGSLHSRIARMFPGGQWGQPDDVACLVAWLVSDEARWITGQVINSEGGFRRQ